MRRALLISVCLSAVLNAALEAEEPVGTIRPPQPVAAPQLLPPVPFPAIPPAERKQKEELLDQKLVELARMRAALKSLQAEVDQLESATGRNAQVMFSIRGVEIDFDKLDDKLERRGITFVGLPGEKIDLSSLLTGNHARGETAPFSAILNSERILLLDFLIKEGCAKVLAEPQITVLSGHTASVLSGEDYKQPTVVSANSYYGTKLELLPRVIPEKTIVLDCRIETQHPAPNAKPAAKGTAPALNKARVQTQAEIQSGETFVITSPAPHGRPDKAQTARLWLIKAEIVAPTGK